MTELRDYKDLDFLFTSPQQTVVYSPGLSVYGERTMMILALVVKFRIYA